MELPRAPRECASFSLGHTGWASAVASPPKAANTGSLIHFRHFTPTILSCFVLINLARSWFRLLVRTDLGAGTQPGSESGQGRGSPKTGWGRPRVALDTAGCKTGPKPGL